MEWTCANCPKKKETDIGEYTRKMLRINALQQGGYPFDANDLTPDEWIDLGIVRRYFERDADPRP
jgi:hypothetical protein